ncbi:hypothetical protein TSOC_006730 [Tetrabaena socialis]|uniref:Uncharacterized protein n=1 Tax=Tetrabaena socialis TaxID=47790 RepID=A0A2J8A2W5_9CHLO|nr:hypothetical protein TSOC_006730 [Tetrabaena socialis]|eukprot:PNH06861.1 hypothetical protein TSOC_006730 [Tetrabaena socialis]
MDWLLARTAVIQGLSDVSRILEAVVGGCDLPTLQRMHHTYLDVRGSKLYGDAQKHVMAATAGSPSADWRVNAEWLEGQGYLRSHCACAEAAQQVDGRDRLEWLQQQRGYPLTFDVVYTAAQHGNADALEFLLAQGVLLVLLSGELPGTATYLAAQGGHLAALKVLHAHGARIDCRAVAAAAGGGHLSVVAWLVEVLGAGCVVLTADVFVGAASSGSAELLA